MSRVVACLVFFAAVAVARADSGSGSAGMSPAELPCFDHDPGDACIDDAHRCVTTLCSRSHHAEDGHIDSHSSYGCVVCDPGEPTLRATASHLAVTLACIGGGVAVVVVGGVLFARRRRKHSAAKPNDA